MKFSDVIEFRKDIYFEGAVQADWFYNVEQSSKVAVNYVFHGNQYFEGVTEQYNQGSNRVDSVNLIEKIAEKFNIPGSNPLTLAIADYGTGKSHLAVTMGHLFSGPDYYPNVYNKIIENISKIDSEEGKSVRKLFSSKNLVLMLNGMKDFNLHSEILGATKKSLKLYGVDDSFLNKISKTQETAANFLLKTEKTSINLYEKYAEKYGWTEKSSELISKLRVNLLTDDEAFSIIDAVFNEVTGQNISWDSGISARAVLDLLVDELCNNQKIFDHIVVLFDEFGRFLEYAAGVNNSGRTGDSALQQMFESAQDAKGKIQIVNFIQSDIKTYLQRVDQTSNITRYIGRYDASDKYHISSNLETVFANLIYRKDRKVFEDKIIMCQCSETKRWQAANTNMNRWLPTKGIWKEYRTFRDVIVEGIYPLHPLSTYILTQLSDYLQKRSSLALINNYIEELKDIELDKQIPLIMPEQLMIGDLFNEMLAAEESGRQTSQFCISYNTILSRAGDKLSKEALKVLRANLILRILKFRTTSYEDVKKAIEFCTGLNESEIKEALNLLEHEYAVLGFDNYANCLDFMADANGYHDYKIVKNRFLAKSSVSIGDFDDIQIRKLFEIDLPLETDFKNNHFIQTDEWLFKQYLYPIEKFTEITAKSIITEWENSTSYNVPKGQLIWLYINRETNPDLLNKTQRLVGLFDKKPIILMIINDDDDLLWKLIQEHKCLLSFDEINIKKFEKYYNDDISKVKLNIANHFKNLKKQRKYLTQEGVFEFDSKMSRELTKIFENIYKNVIPFNFDGFTGGHGITTFFTIFNLLLSDSISYDVIHNFPIDVRNRIDAVLSCEASNSWKCLGREGKIMPPENSLVNSIYNEIQSEYISRKALPLIAIFMSYTKVPYGLCDEIILLLIAVFIANNNYGMRIAHRNNVYTISDWKTILTSDKKSITENERKRLISIVKESSLIQIDAGAVEEKFLKLFNEIDTNKSLRKYAKLEIQLNELLKTESIPQVLKNRYTISEKNIKDGLAAYRNWSNEIKNIQLSLECQQLNDRVHKAIDAIITTKKLKEKYSDIYQKYLPEEFDEDIKNLIGKVDFVIKSNFNTWLLTLKCVSEESVYDLKYEEKTYCERLQDCGYDNYSEQLKKHIEKEIKDIDCVKEKVALRKEIAVFITNSANINEYTSIQAIDDILENGEELQDRISVKESSFDEEDRKFLIQFKSKINIIRNTKKGIENEINSIQSEINGLNDISKIFNIKNRINKLFGRGLRRADYPILSNFLIESIVFENDYRDLASCANSLKLFETKKNELLKKYENPTLSFNQIDILNSKIDSMMFDFKFADAKWKRDNLEINLHDRKSIIIWKDKINNVPDYLSQDTLMKIEETKKVVEEMLSKQNVQTIIDYFEKLTSEEKVKCLEELKMRI